MNRNEAFQWIVAGHAALVVEESKCNEAALFAEITHDWQGWYLEAMIRVLRGDRVTCADIAERAKHTAKVYLCGRGVAGVGYLPPSMRRQMLYFGARFALTLAAILDNVDWDAK
mgnify:CR=1 FL=1